LDLLRQTCEAVRYAHSFATIHRDLKPSNILVTAERQVKLLDFGIAKQIDSESFNEITYDALSPMTPVYAAPEQKSHGNIGVFTDIYALGIMFYELVVGRLPEPVSSESSVCLLPALRKAETIVEIHPTQYGDLDLLCATCTQHDPQMRYGSVEALLRDIDAFREGRPLNAKRADLRELFTKYLRRNKAALSAAVGASVLLITTVMFFTIRLEQSRARAQAETQRLERMRQFTEGLFQGGNPSAGPQINMTLTDLLRHGEITADSMSQEPPLQIDMLSTLGTVYQRIGNLERADHLLTQVVPQTQRSYGERSSEYVDSLVSLGLLRKDQGRVQDARKLLEKALLLAGEFSDRQSKTRERATWALASVAALEGDYRSSKDLMLQAIDLARRTQRTQSEQFVLDLQGLADDEFYLGEYQAAQQLYEQTLSLDFKVNGENHPSVAQLYNGLGNIALNRDELPTSISYFQKSLAIDEGWYGASHPDVADDLSTLSRPLILMKNYDEARKDLTRSLSIMLQVYGENHSRVATAYTSLGILAFQRDELHEAESDFNKALAIWTRVYGRRHPFVALCYANLASAEMASKNYPQAIDFFHKALSIYETNSPQQSFNAAVAHMKLGRALLRSKEYDAAIPESLAGFRYFVNNNDTQSQYRIGAKLDLDQELAHADGSSISDNIREELRRTP
jgi:serine/threonine-protein kinase